MKCVLAHVDRMRMSLCWICFALVEFLHFDLHFVTAFTFLFPKSFSVLTDLDRIGFIYFFYWGLGIWPDRPRRGHIAQLSV